MTHLEKLADDLHSNPERAGQLLEEYIDKVSNTNSELECIASGLARSLKLFESVKNSLEDTPELLASVIAAGNTLTFAHRAVHKLAAQLKTLSNQ